MVNKEKINQELKNWNSASDELIEHFQAGLNSCMYSKDTARHLGYLLDTDNPLVPWDDISGSIISLTNEYQKYIQDRKLPIDLTSSAAGTIVASCDSSIYRVEISNSSISEEQRRAYDNFHYFASQSISEQTIRNLLLSFNLDKHYSGKESSISLFDTSLDVFHKPVSQNLSPSASLIPLREAIDLIIDYFLKHRQNQKIAKNRIEKIKSILWQAKYENVNEFQIQLLANEAEELHSDLSESKNSSIDRKQWEILLNRGLLFIQNLLLSIDRTKLRN